MSTLVEYGCKRKKMQLRVWRQKKVRYCSVLIDVLFYRYDRTRVDGCFFSFPVRKTAFDDNNGGRAERYRFPGGARPSAGNNRCVPRCWKTRQMLADRERAGFHGSPDARSTTPADRSTLSSAHSSLRNYLLKHRFTCKYTNIYLYIYIIFVCNERSVFPIPSGANNLIGLTTTTVWYGSSHRLSSRKTTILRARYYFDSETKAV